MKRTAIAAAAIVGVAAYGATEKTAFTVDFESPYTLAGDSQWSNTTDAEIVTDQTKNSQVLSIDSSDEVLYTPAVASQTSKVSLDVYLTPGTEAPTVPQDAKLVIYLNSSGALMGKAAGDANWTQIATGVQPNVWTNITMAFASTTVTVTVGSSSETLGGNVELATVNSVGFKGTGLVDNFVGSYFKEYGAASSDSSSEGSVASGATIEVNDSTKAVTFNYAGTAAAGTVQFVRIYDDRGKYVTVRVNGSNNGSADASKLTGTITKVVAYYGDTVSNVDSSTPTTPTSAAVINDNGMKVGVNVTGKSGVYYTLVVPDTSTAIAESVSVLVPPEKDGDQITLTAPVSQNAWGTVKFQVKATDTSLTNGN